MKKTIVTICILFAGLQAQAKASEAIKQNCVDVLTFALSVTDLEAAVACSYGQDSAAIALTVELANFMGEENVASAGYLSSKTKNRSVLNCAAGLVMGGFQDASHALDTCQKTR